MMRHAIAMLVLASLSSFASAQARSIRDDTLLAGVRAYPSDVRNALLVAARDPQQLKTTADHLAKEGKLELPADLTPELKSAYGILSANPDLILFAADQVDALGRVAELHERSPEAVDRRWEDLARGYDQARRDSARVWQKMIESEPMLLREYINLVDNFSRQRREQNHDFATVQVTDRAYYYACPPNDALLAQLDSQTIAPELKTLIERWWHRYGDGALDTEAQRASRTAMRVLDAGAVIDWSATERQAMWRPMDAQVPHPIGLAPMMLQPLDDQPREARLAFAIAENMRLWAPAMASNDTPADALSDGAPQADATPDQPMAALSPQQYAANVDTYGAAPYSADVAGIPYPPNSAYSVGLLDGDVYGAYPYSYSYGVPAFSLFGTFGYGGYCYRPRCFGSPYYYDYGAYPACGDPYGIWGPAFGFATRYYPHRSYVALRGSIGGVRSGSHGVIHLDTNRAGTVRSAPFARSAARPTTVQPLQNPFMSTPTGTRAPLANPRGPSNPAPRYSPTPAPASPRMKPSRASVQPMYRAPVMHSAPMQHAAVMHSVSHSQGGGGHSRSLSRGGHH